MEANIESSLKKRVQSVNSSCRKSGGGQKIANDVGGGCRGKVEASRSLSGVEIEAQQTTRWEQKYGKGDEATRQSRKALSNSDIVQP
jgi:hypothetical protein